ncbi:hypothetical protein [Actinacidiphila acidipaludis]|uniref:Uncharacterized protein n=1 Tax=Actinacidiphila acidipaludis TaxID=2873382 RepID=A0ABS7Q075_9ACTN|nr:hypothetical protein [Streptomyces acidipaludis]MBY8876508.1 hypothetical protein [Streptomyces acidipaludis]
MGDTKLPLVLPSAPLGEAGESLEELIGDCRRMAARWRAPAPQQAAGAAATAASLHGITVPEASAHAVSAMADYGG